MILNTQKVLVRCCCEKANCHFGIRGLPRQSFYLSVFEHLWGELDIQRTFAEKLHRAARKCRKNFERNKIRLFKALP